MAEIAGIQAAKKTSDLVSIQDYLYNRFALDSTMPLDSPGLC